MRETTPPLQNNNEKLLNYEQQKVNNFSVISFIDPLVVVYFSFISYLCAKIRTDYD